MCIVQCTYTQTQMHTQYKTQQNSQWDKVD